MGGLDPYSSDDELWAVNCGLWTLGDRVDNERFATLSYAGVVRVVAEISTRDDYPTAKGDKWAVVGEVLRPGDPVRDMLVGRQPPHNRNPVAYFDTADVDQLSTAERMQTPARDRVTMLVTWNPARWHWADYEEAAAAVSDGGILNEPWSTGNRSGGIEPGDRVFLLLQGERGRGVIGSGVCTSRIFQDTHWDLERHDDHANYALIAWDQLLAPEDTLDRTELITRIPAGGEWRPQGGGTLLRPDVADALERLWAEHLGHAVPVAPRSSPTQAWQMNPERRKKVEDVAQRRLSEHFEQIGWTVKDTRHGNPYDAIATKGDQTLYLEAKGTETSGAAVIVTPGEVAWARDHLGQCVLGILADVRFLRSGDVDPASGTFTVVDWNPDAGVLAPRDHNWTPPRQNSRNVTEAFPT